MNSKINGVQDELNSKRIYLFNQVKNSGLDQATNIANQNGISLNILKSKCHKAGKELIAKRGHLLPEEQSVFNWSKL